MKKIKNEYEIDNKINKSYFKQFESTIFTSFDSLNNNNFKFNNKINIINNENKFDEDIK